VSFLETSRLFKEGLEEEKITRKLERRLKRKVGKKF
jgi:hypothetical protein